MISDILLTNAFLYRLDKKQWKNKQPYPPLATLYAASILKSKGYQVRLFDQSLEKDLSKIESYIKMGTTPILVIYEDGFNYLTKMCLTVMREAALQMTRLAKEVGMKVIVSSSDATDQYVYYHQCGADYIIHGEGELTLIELIDCIGRNGDVNQVLGISHLMDGVVKRNASRPVLRDLDTLPLPAWDLIDIEEYRKVWMKKHHQMALNIATTRGCPFKCNWCAKPIYGNRYNSRSVSNVLDEITYLVNQFGISYFWFCDDIFGLKPGWVQQFNDQLKARGLKIKYKIQSRVDLLLKENTIDSLTESGLDIVWVGAESGSQEILDAMDKGTRVEQIYQATQMIKSKGSKIGFFLQFGYIDEDIGDIKKTIHLLLDLMPDEIGVSVSYPLPGTGFYEKVKQDLHKKSNWSDSDDLDVMYSSKYPTAFYKKLHRLIHYRFRVKKGWMTLIKVLKNPGKIELIQLRQIASMLFYAPHLLTGLRLLRR